MLRLLISLWLISQPLASATASHAQTISIENYAETVKLLPEKYQERVLQNIAGSGSNRLQLLQTIQKIDPAYRDALGFILAHAPKEDLQQLSADFLIENIELSYLAKKNTPWGSIIPNEVFLNNVLPYVNVTEKREAWRRDFYQRFLKSAVSEGSIQKAVKRLNREVFDTFNVRYHATKRKKPDQSPSESIAIGWSSCTGLSILIADALRAVGIPARLAGIPQWPTVPGNHTWVEVWDNGWHYIEAASDGEYDHTWFTERTRTADPRNEMTRIYAVSFERTELKFPLVWNMATDSVRAVDVTASYTRPALNYSLASSVTSANDTITGVWNQYKGEQQKDPVRLREFQNKAIDFNGLSMRYEYSKIGPKPAAGYPLYIALHGGGGAPAPVNDGQWNHMKIYYRDAVKNGIYLAPRGVTNTWNLHFVGESFVMYDRLIENMILFEDVDPNRVYVLGFSAGGDGVYQIATRMSDRFAAANMSAGHPNGVGLRNLYQLPFLIQVGEMDGAYSRNRVDAEYCVALENLKQQDKEGYKSECNIHFQHPHNFLDNQPQGIPQRVIANPQKWLKEKDRESVERNTNAIHWLDQFTRNPIPHRVVWDLTTRANRTGIDKNNQALWSSPNHGQQSYWLDIGTHSAEILGTNEVIAHLDRSNNAVVVEKTGSYLKILLKQEMLDLKLPIKVLVGGQSLEVQVRPNLKTLSKTLADRGDVNFIFEAALLLEKDTSSNSFRISQIDG